MPNDIVYVVETNTMHKVATESLEYQAMRNENETLRNRLDNKLFEVNKLRNKVQFLTGELDACKQLINQIRSRFAASNGNQHAINLALDAANDALVEMAKRKPPRTKKLKPGSSASNCSCCSAMDKPYACDWPNCGKRFRQKPHLEQHKNVHTGRRFICEFPDCGKSFVRKFNLDEHQKMHNGQNANMCNFADCGKVFSSKYSLTRHQQVRHGLNM